MICRHCERTEAILLKIDGLLRHSVPRNDATINVIAIRQLAEKQSVKMYV